MDYVPRKRDGKELWLQNMSNNVVAQGPGMGTTVPDAAAAKVLADEILAAMQATDAAQAAVDAARLVEKNVGGPKLAQLRAKIRNWKTLPNYAASGAEGVLKLKGTEDTFDPVTYKPVITVSLEAGQIKVEFTKLGVDGVAVYCRLRGTATWRKLGTDTDSPYYDTAPLANPAVPEVREYMARGMVGDDEVGLDSDIVSVTFAG